MRAPLEALLDLVDVVVAPNRSVEVVEVDGVAVDCFVAVPVAVDPSHFGTSLTFHNRRMWTTATIAVLPAHLDDLAGLNPFDRVGLG